MRQKKLFELCFKDCYHSPTEGEYLFRDYFLINIISRGNQFYSIKVDFDFNEKGDLEFKWCRSYDMRFWTKSGSLIKSKGINYITSFDEEFIKSFVIDVESYSLEILTTNFTLKIRLINEQWDLRGVLSIERR